MSRKQALGQKIGFWTMVRDVLTQSMNKGVFIPAMIGILLMVMILKMPPGDVSALARAMGRGLASRCGWGYGLFVVVLIAWPLTMKIQRRMMSKELNRTCNERNQLQEKIAGKKLESSK